MTPEIVNEVHDLNQIVVEVPDWNQVAMQQAGVWFRDGAWDTCEMGISQEEAQRRYEAANTPELKAKVIADLKERAIRRAGLDMTDGRVSVFVAGKPAWHGLGVQVREAVGSADAIKLAGLDWRVEKQPLSYVFNGETRTQKDTYGIIRQDTGECLGTVGSRYVPFQNADGFSFLDSVLGSFGGRYESAGAVFGGSRVWMLVLLPDQIFRVTKNDVVEPYALFTNNHDGSGCARCFPTAQRVVCANTLRLAQNDAARGLSIRHAGNLRTAVKEAEFALGLAVKNVAEFRDNAGILARVAVEARPYFTDLLDTVCDVSENQLAVGVDALIDAVIGSQEVVDAERKRLERAFRVRREIMDDIIERYESERCGIDGVRGTGWAALNAITEAADHGKLGGRFTGSDATRAGRRFDSIVSGWADEIKQFAYARILTLAV